MKSLVPVDTWFCHNTPQSIIDSFLNKQTWLHWINWVIVKAVTNLSTNRTSKVFFYIYFLHHTHTLGMQIKRVFTVKPPPPPPPLPPCCHNTELHTRRLWTLTLSQCTLAGPVYIGMSLVDPVYTGIPLGDPANTCRVHWNTTGKTPHWNATGKN